MLKIDKAVQIMIDGDEVRIIASICELAQRHISARKGRDRGADSPYVDEFSTREVVGIETMIARICGA